MQKFIETARSQMNSNRRAGILAQILFTLDLLNCVQRMNGIKEYSDEDGVNMRLEIDVVVLLYLSDFSPVVRRLAIKVSRAAFSLWHDVPELFVF